MMKKFLYLIIGTLLGTALFSSCLNSDIDESEYSVECEVSNVEFEHRWAIESNVEGIYTLYFKGLDITKVIDAEKLEVLLNITVPGTSGNFTSEIRDEVSLSKIACILTVSRGAKVTPLNGAPVLGTLGDYSGKTYTYRVTSASGNYKDWTIVISSFIK